MADTPDPDMTLDIAALQFETNPNQANARTYAHTALEYWFDGRIEDDSLLDILYRIRNG